MTSTSASLPLRLTPTTLDHARHKPTANPPAPRLRDACAGAKPQVRSPLRPVQGSQHTPRGASSETRGDNADGPNQRCWRRFDPMQLTSNAERSRVSVNGRLPKPVMPRTIGSPPRLPASPLPRKQMNPKGTVDRNAQSERRNASQPVQPRAHPRHLEWDGERRGRRPGVRLVEIEELRPRSPRRIPMPRANDRPHRPSRHCLAPPRT